MSRLIVYKYTFPEILTIDECEFHYTYIGSTSQTTERRIHTGYGGEFSKFLHSHNYLTLKDFNDKGVIIETLFESYDCSRSYIEEVEASFTDEERMFNPACLNRRSGLNKIDDYSQSIGNAKLKVNSDDMLKKRNETLSQKDQSFFDEINNKRKKTWSNKSDEEMNAFYSRCSQSHIKDGEWFINGNGPYSLLREAYTITGGDPHRKWYHLGKPLYFDYKPRNSDITYHFKHISICDQFNLNR